MKSLQTAGNWIYKVYIGIGVIAMAVMSLGVISSVIMRYFFSISFVFLEEMLTVLFTFTTFWGIGACLLEDEHIIIDFFVNRMKPGQRRILDIFNYVMVLVINVMMIYYSSVWIRQAGNIMAKAIRIQLKYIYVIMPIGFGIGVLCTVIKLILLIMQKEFPFKPEHDSEFDL